MIKSNIIHSLVPAQLSSKSSCRKEAFSILRHYSSSNEKCSLSIYSTLTKRKEPIKLKNSNVLYWYSCGPTVYDSAHIGHASSYVNFDIIRRILTKYFRVNVVNLMNITDIDDKIIRRAIKDKKAFTEISSHYEQEFLEDLGSLNCQRPTIILRVSQHVKEIQAFISNLIERDLAYVTKSGSVYFRSQKFKKLEPFIAQAADDDSDPRTKENLEKDHPFDFALWKARKEPNEPAWQSPWGFGRPGWHIECSTLASIAFGKHLDIHSGGKDLIFPHHQNEIIQCCAYHNMDSWSTYWLHTGHLHLKGDVKMSKSLSNTISIRELISKYTSNQFRLFCLLSPYRYDKEFTDDKMLKAKALDYTFSSFLNFCKTYSNNLVEISALNLDEDQIFSRLSQARQTVHEALCDDFNTPKVIEELNELVGYMNRLFQTKSPRHTDESNSVFNRHYGCVMSVSNFVSDILDTFGLVLETSEHSDQNSTSSGVKVEQVVESSIKFRKSVRNLALEKTTPKETKLNILKLCDELRNDLQKANIELKDTKENTLWQIRPRQN